MIKNQTYDISSQLLNYDLLTTFIERFWTDVFSPLVLDNSDKHLMLLVKISFNEANLDCAYKTLGYLKNVNHSEKEDYTDYLAGRLAYLNESYISNPINKINFSYIEKDGLAPEDDRRLLQDVSDSELTFHRFNNMLLPITMKLEEYGIVRGTTNFDMYTRYFINNGAKNYEIDVSNDGNVNNVTILGAVDLKWTDTKINDGAGFKREIGKSTKYFLDGVNVLNKQLLPVKRFKRQTYDRKRALGFITMDIETINNNGKLTPYLICGYNGYRYITSYATTLKDQSKLFSTFLNKLLDDKFSRSQNLTVYAHNLSGFDGIFLMRQLLPFGKVEPLIFNGKLISIKLKSENKIVTFKDSYLLLPLSLRHLCKAFGVLVPKGHFPFNMTNIHYTGTFPKFEEWTDITQSFYDSLKSGYKNRMWSFKNESVKYCQLDCQCLHEVLTKFNELIFSNFSLNVHRVLTLPALAMKIYKSHFMPDNTIYQLGGEVEQAIRQSYSGGAVDVYIPHNRIGQFSKEHFKKLYYYDVNSLYPTVMSKFPMPIGKPMAFEGNIRLVEPTAYGIFYCNIKSPNFLQHPILQRRIKGKGTVAGLGSWTGWISSIELDNAIKYGYKFEILKGYQFETGDIFSSYVQKMYELRMEYPKPHAMNLIAKLLLNSLYGKFGMRVEKTVVDIYDLNTESGKMALQYLLNTSHDSVQDFIEIDENKYLFLRNSLSNVLSEDAYHGSDVNIAIASAITAGARVYMSAFKNNPGYNLYYSDTDSIVIDKELDPMFVGNGLGQVKLEHAVGRAVFLAPKVYGLLDINGRETIKIKGVTEEIASTIHINDLERLLYERSQKEFNQEKWYKSLIKGEIKITDVLYNLKVTSNKRAAIYIDGVFSKTEPLDYNEL